MEWAVGRNNEGQLETGTTNRNTPTQILSGSVNNFYADLYHSFIVRKTEAYGLWGKILMDSLVMVPLRIEYTHSDNVLGCKTSCWRLLSLKLKTDGSLWAFKMVMDNWRRDYYESQCTDANSGVASLSDVTPQLLR